MIQEERHALARSSAARQRRQAVANIGKRQKLYEVSIEANKSAGLLRWVRYYISREIGMFKTARSQSTWDEAIVTRAATLFVYWYVTLRSFAAAHALGFVSRRTAAKRLGHCLNCAHRVPVAGQDYCEERKCNCPRRRWWPFSQLRWWLRLRNVSCPLGHWKRGKTS